MAITRIDITTFLAFHFRYPVIDVRSEGEFNHAHIPGAVSIPLFNNEERKNIGTSYKQETKQKAIKIGLKAFGSKMVDIVEAAEKLVDDKSGNGKTVVVHCWRGGMRSGAVAWLLDLYGFKVYTLIGGYKAFRRWGIQQLQADYPLKVLGGYTGSGKSYVLQELKKQNNVVIDLEGLASHKGSAFGNIGMPPQPSQEMFENNLALELWRAVNTLSEANSGALLMDHHPTSPAIWIEDESQRIGLVNIPTPLFAKMRSKPVYFLDIPFEERLKHIVEGYGKANKELLVNAIIRIQKRLGGLETKNAINYILENDIPAAFSILLRYYDKYYLKGLYNRSDVGNILTTLKYDTVDPPNIAATVIKQQTQAQHV